MDLYFRESRAAINFPCFNSWLKIGVTDVIFSKIPHGLKNNNNKCGKLQEYRGQRFLFFSERIAVLIVIIISIRGVFLRI